MPAVHSKPLKFIFNEQQFVESIKELTSKNSDKILFDYLFKTTIPDIRNVIISIPQVSLTKQFYFHALLKCLDVVYQILERWVLLNNKKYDFQKNCKENLNLSLIETRESINKEQYSLLNTFTEYQSKIHLLIKDIKPTESDGNEFYKGLYNILYYFIEQTTLHNFNDIGKNPKSLKTDFKKLRYYPISDYFKQYISRTLDNNIINIEQSINLIQSVKDELLLSVYNMTEKYQKIMLEVNTYQSDDIYFLLSILIKIKAKTQDYLQTDSLEKLLELKQEHSHILIFEKIPDKSKGYINNEQAYIDAVNNLYYLLRVNYTLLNLFVNNMEIPEETKTKSLEAIFCNCRIIIEQLIQFYDHTEQEIIRRIVNGEYNKILTTHLNYIKDRFCRIFFLYNLLPRDIDDEADDNEQYIAAENNVPIQAKAIEQQNEKTNALPENYFDNTLVDESNLKQDEKINKNVEKRLSAKEKKLLKEAIKHTKHLERLGLNNIKGPDARLDENPTLVIEGIYFKRIMNHRGEWYAGYDSKIAFNTTVESTITSSFFNSPRYANNAIGVKGIKRIKDSEPKSYSDHYSHKLKILGASGNTRIFGRQYIGPNKITLLFFTGIGDHEYLKADTKATLTNFSTVRRKP